VRRSGLATVVAAGSVLAVVDGFSAFAINALFFNQPSFSRTFQGVAAALIGKEAFTLGVTGMLIGIAIHIAVAFTWTTLYFAVQRNWPALRRAAASRVSIATIGPLLGAIIWVSMCYIVFPMTHIPHVPIASRSFVINFIQHILVVGPLIVAMER
jgi:hypothetical protein